MSATLQLIFRNTAGRNVTLSVPDALEDLDSEVVGSVMADILSRNIFHTTGGDLQERVRAQLVTREVNTLVEY
ncbi:MAG: DUF2922 domain-containing protein [Bacillota bacterium]